MSLYDITPGKPNFQGKPPRITNPPDSTDSLPEPISNIISILEKVKDGRNISISDLIKKEFGRDKDFHPINTTLFWYRGYLLHSNLRMTSDETSEKLRFVNDLKISCAPKLIQHIQIDSFKSATILYYSNCEEKMPLKYIDFENNERKVTKEAKERFLNDAITLLNNGVIHPFFLKGPEHWYIDQNGNILLDSWDMLEKMGSYNNDKAIQMIRKHLELT